MLLSIDLPDLCAEDRQDWPVVRERRFAPIIVLTCHFVPGVNDLAQLLVAFVHREQDAVSVARCPLLL